MAATPEPTDPVVVADPGHSVEELEAMHVPTRKIILVGLVVWAVALVLTLVVPAWHTGDRSWWPWACVTGLVLGVIGYAYVARGRGNAATAE
jgi:hypothetical protein